MSRVASEDIRPLGEHFPPLLPKGSGGKLGLAPPTNQPASFFATIRTSQIQKKRIHVERAGGIFDHTRGDPSVYIIDAGGAVPKSAPSPFEPLLQFPPPSDRERAGTAHWIGWERGRNGVRRRGVRRRDGGGRDGGILAWGHVE